MTKLDRPLSVKSYRRLVNPSQRRSASLSRSSWRVRWTFRHVPPRNDSYRAKCDGIRGNGQQKRTNTCSPAAPENLLIGSAEWLIAILALAPTKPYTT